MPVASLIERWFPAPVVGAESLRERGAITALPPVSFLHVWWARRPLTSSRAVVVAALLPAWPTDDDVAADPAADGVRQLLEAEFPSGEDEYHSWFIRAIGIAGDPVRGRARLASAKVTGEKLADGGYGYPRAFTVSPSDADLARIHRLAAARDPEYGRCILDPFAGGGAIPFEAARYGCDVVANELNPVACATLAGTVMLPITMGSAFPDVVNRYGARWASLVRSGVEQYFPIADDGESIVGYLWAHAIPCPETGFPTPLMPNSWLANSARHKTAISLSGDPATGEISRRVVHGDEATVVGPTGTYKGGRATSLFTGQVLSRDAIQLAAQGGHLTEILLVVAVNRPGVRGRAYRSPTPGDLAGIEMAGHAYEDHEVELELDGLLPTEAVEPGAKTDEPRRMGLTAWKLMFTKRQRLVFAEALRSMAVVVEECRTAEGDDAAKALSLGLYYALAKGLNYNARLSGWDPYRQTGANVFDRHDFAFKHTFTELDGARALFPWALGQVGKAAGGVVGLLGHSDQQELGGGSSSSSEGTVRLVRGSAAALASVETASIDALITDPPYYDNVIYSECSDFFYVWMKRALRTTWPEFCELDLTDKQQEAVANRALYADVASHAGRGRRTPGTKTASEMADDHYERMLAACWREAHRVLREGGVMVVMFTHKRVDAWDRLGASLLNAGFAIEASWPVHTESEHSMHQAKKNSASSTVFLTCRKRGSTEPAYFSDMRSEIQRTAREAAKRFASDGLTGIDLTLSAYGPVLAVLSRRWPVYTGQLGDDGERQVIRPEDALILAYEEVARLKKRALLGGKDTPFDAYTDWYLTAWNDFQAAEFPAGEALKLSLATHIDLDDVDKGRRLVATKGGSATLQTPAQRVAAGKLDPQADEFPTQVDRLHALMYLYEHDGFQAARQWLTRHGWLEDQTLRDLVQAAGNAVPRLQDKNGFVRDEARVLDGLAATLFPDVVLKAVIGHEPSQQVLELT